MNSGFHLEGLLGFDNRSQMVGLYNPNLPDDYVDTNDKILNMIEDIMFAEPINLGETSNIIKPKKCVACFRNIGEFVYPGNFNIWGCKNHKLPHMFPYKDIICGKICINGKRCPKISKFYNKFDDSKTPILCESHKNKESIKYKFYDSEAYLKKINYF